MLRAEGRITARRVGMSPAIHDELERFTSHLEQVCGLAAKTRAARRWWVGQFLADQYRALALTPPQPTGPAVAPATGRTGFVSSVAIVSVA